MALRALRPTGNRILASNAPSLAEPLLDGAYHTYWLNSGTAALALAMIASAKTKTSNAEVILPAYGCPDLVAAAHYARVHPILVDIQPDSPHYDYTQLQAAISPNTVAIVAATLLGIRADNKSLREVIGTRPILIIEDSAQWFPRHTAQSFFGDLVVLSFGRGKPVSALSGGALMSRAALPETLLAQITPARQSFAATLQQRCKRIGYNALIHPILYGLAEKAPFLHIGITEFHELPHIGAMHKTAERLLPPNIGAYRQRDLNIQRRWRSALAELSHPLIIDLCAAHSVPADYVLPRYPLLIKNELLKNDKQRDRIYSRLRQQGLGASIMYGQPLMKIENVSDHASLFETDLNAAQFSAQLLTLPTHEAVTDDTIARTMDLLRNELFSIAD